MYAGTRYAVDGVRTHTNACVGVSENATRKGECGVGLKEYNVTSDNDNHDSDLVKPGPH